LPQTEASDDRHHDHRDRDNPDDDHDHHTYDTDDNPNGADDSLHTAGDHPE
jgi:hypothetical protein